MERGEKEKHSDPYETSDYNGADYSEAPRPLRRLLRVRGAGLLW
jgi:hypothetical protein